MGCGGSKNDFEKALDNDEKSDVLRGAALRALTTLTHPLSTY